MRRHGQPMCHAGDLSGPHRILLPGNTPDPRRLRRSRLPQAAGDAHGSRRLGTDRRHRGSLLLDLARDCHARHGQRDPRLVRDLAHGPLHHPPGHDDGRDGRHHLDHRVHPARRRRAVRAGHAPQRRPRLLPRLDRGHAGHHAPPDHARAWFLAGGRRGASLPRV